MLEPFVFIYSFFFLLALGLLHIVLWRYVQVKMKIFWMFGVFFFIPTIVSLITFFYFLNDIWVLQAGVLILAIGGAYLMSYPAIQAQSPTLVMLVFIHRNPGASESDIVKAMVSEKLVEDRIQDLGEDGLIKKNGDHLELTSAGFFIAWFFNRYRSLLGLPRGRG